MHDIFSQSGSGNNNPGFALFYAVVVVAVISSLGAVLSNLIVREAELSATARQSSLAYYSADAGIECAQYWDLKEDHFPRGSASDEGNIQCGGETGIDVTASDSGGDQVYEFEIDTASICADVKIVKRQIGGRRITEIESVGADECGDTRVKRALRTSY